MALVDVTTRKTLNKLEREILLVLLYSDLFKYPLKLVEIVQRINSQEYEESLIEAAIISMQEEGLVYHFGEFYTTNNDSGLLERRINGNALATKLKDKATRFMKLIAHFPFVKAIFISGSISKNFAESESDVDFFVICKHGRVWLLKTLLVVFKKTLLLNSHKYFCANYIISDTHLEIEAKNIYTANEIKTLIPVYGIETCKYFIEANNWVDRFLPNLDFTFDSVYSPKKQVTKNSLERLLSWKFVDQIDTMMMNLIRKNWVWRYRNLYNSEEEFVKILSVNKNASRAHHRNFHLVPQIFMDRLREFEEEHEVKLT